jgi:hypothetical protein
MRFFVEDRTLVDTMGKNARHFTEIHGTDAANAYSTILKSNTTGTGQSCRLMPTTSETLAASAATA